MRESDLRRHLINEVGIQDDVIQNDGRPDPRFQATAEQLTAQHITDYQLDYAVHTLSRLAAPATPRVATAAAGRRASR